MARINTTVLTEAAIAAHVAGLTHEEKST